MHLRDPGSHRRLWLQPVAQALIAPRLRRRHSRRRQGAGTSARFSADGRWLATGGADASLKLYEVEALRAQFAPTEEGALAERPNIRVYLDHAQSAASADGCLGPGSGGASAAQQINDADFHPTTPILISAADDSTIKFFDFRYTARRAFRVIQDTHRVKSVAFHPCGEYVLAGTEHALLHLYDVNTFKCFLSAAVQPPHIGGAVNQASSAGLVRYSQTGAAYASCHKDGAVRLWDGVTGRCVRVLGGPDISTAASGAGQAAAGAGEVAARPEAISVAFSRDQNENSSFICIEPYGQGVSGAANGCREQGGGQAAFDHVEELVLSTSGVTNEVRAPMGSTAASAAPARSTTELALSNVSWAALQVVVWDVVTGKEVARLPSGHTGTPTTLAHSPAEAVFATVGADHVVRLWVEQAESL
eukprot:SM000027S09614  [mRNA]  locus=s27:295890:298453:+ [translate_table: standard]